jgi:hypothetical protein
MDTLTKEVVAIKRISKEYKNSIINELAYEELDLQHANLLRYYDSAEDGEYT